MSRYRVLSMLRYGAAALVGAALLSSSTIPRPDPHRYGASPPVT